MKIEYIDFEGKVLPYDGGMISQDKARCKNLKKTVSHVGQDGVTREYKLFNVHTEKLGALDRIARLVAVVALACLVFPLCTSTFWDFVYEVKTGKRLVAVYKERFNKLDPAKILEDAENQRVEIIQKAQEEAEDVLKKAKKGVALQVNLFSKQLRAFDKTRKKESEHTVELLCKNDEKRYAHKCLLRISPYFDQEFDDKWEDTKNKTVVLKEHPAACVDLFLDSLYGMPISTDVPVTHLLHSIIIADQLMMPELGDTFKTALRNCIENNPQTLVEAWQYEDQSIVLDERIKDYLIYGLFYGPSNLEQAKSLFIYFQKLADNQDPLGQYLVGYCYLEGIGVGKDGDKAVKYFEEGVKKGDPYAQNNLGFCYLDGIGVKQDFSVAFKMFQESAKQDNSTALGNLGYMYELGKGVEKDLIQAVTFYEKSCLKGNLISQITLARCYEEGIGVKKDLDKAEQLYKKGAAIGFYKQQYELGIFYIDNFKNKKHKALKLYEKAASYGYAQAMGPLGIFYQSGWGVEVDEKKAMEWYEKGAALDDHISQWMLGVMYRVGHIVQQDVDKAFNLLSKCAKQGFSDGQFQLGKCYEYGQGVQADLAKAIEYYRLAAKKGQDDAIQQLQQLGVSVEEQ